ncbi:MAG: hypothetical protein ABR521_14585 [Gaiellaceae bacterium]
MELATQKGGNVTGRGTRMERREREELMREGGVRGESVRERAARLLLERDLEGSPLFGRPLPRRLRNFQPSVESFAAALGGPLPYMARLREIEALTAAHERALEEARAALALECRDDPASFGRRWSAVAAGWDFTAVNDLIGRHNRFFPAESRLPMDPLTRDFVLVNGRHYSRRPLGARWILERFPPSLDEALRQAAA